MTGYSACSAAAFGSNGKKGKRENLAGCLPARFLEGVDTLDAYRNVNA